MQIHALHPWDLTPAAAVALQRQLAEKVDVRTPLTECRLVAGADVSYNRFSNVFWAGVVVLRFPELTLVEKQGARRESPFPYIPGLLSFREGPALLEAFALLQSDPDVILFDGQGIAHPRRLGIASHMGLFLEKPSIGCAKSLLTGKYKDPGPKAGDVSPLVDAGEVIGQVVRTKDKVKPLFISPGHRIDLPSAVRLVLGCHGGYRLPEPTRQAHLHVNELRRQAACGSPRDAL